MTWIDALILGIIQGLTEFLPVSSSGHLEIGKYILLSGQEIPKDVSFTVAVHGATVLSTLIVFRKDILDLIKGIFQFKMNESMKYAVKIAISMIPVGIVGVFFKDYVESFFGSDLAFVGSMLLITATLLAFTFWAKNKNKEISYSNAFVIGLAQAAAVLPGISRSGATIATGLLLGNKKESVARFSFLMVIIPILGENVLELVKGDFAQSSISVSALSIGFIAAFLSGLLACTWMLNLVKKGKLIYFAIYCLIVGILAIVW